MPPKSISHAMLAFLQAFHFKHFEIGLWSGFMIHDLFEIQNWEIDHHSLQAGQTGIDFLLMCNF